MSLIKQELGQTATNSQRLWQNVLLVSNPQSNAHLDKVTPIWLVERLNRRRCYILLYHATVGPRHYHFKCWYRLISWDLKWRERLWADIDGSTQKRWRHHSHFSLKKNTFAGSVLMEFNLGKWQLVLRGDFFRFLVIFS